MIAVSSSRKRPIAVRSSSLNVLRESPDVFGERHHVAQYLLACVRRDREQQLAAIGGMRTALEVTALGQPVDERRDGAGRDVDAVSELARSEDSFGADVRDRHQLWLAHVQAPAKRDVQLDQSDVEPARGLAQLLGCRGRCGCRARFLASPRSPHLQSILGR